MTTTTATKAQKLVATSILADAQEGTAWTQGKVYLGTIPGIDLQDAECCAMLDELRRVGALRFARADLVAAMDPGLVAKSEWKLPGGLATFHFLIVD